MSLDFRSMIFRLQSQYFKINRRRFSSRNIFVGIFAEIVEHYDLTPFLPHMGKFDRNQYLVESSPLSRAREHSIRRSFGLKWGYWLEASPSQQLPCRCQTWVVFTYLFRNINTDKGNMVFRKSSTIGTFRRCPGVGQKQTHKYCDQICTQVTQWELQCKEY